MSNLHRYYDASVQLSEGCSGSLDVEESRHALKAMRQRSGDAIRVFDAHGAEFVCVIEAADGGSVQYRAERAVEGETESVVQPILGMALAKSDKFELVCQKATELGVAEIVPFYSRHCVAAPTDAKREAAKHERRQSILLSAVKQCGRRRIPRLDLPMALDDLLQRYQPPQITPRLIAWEGADAASPLLSERLKNWNPADLPRPAILIGPEGGWDASEIDLAKQHGWEPVSLGRRILRCETAALAALSVIMSCASEM
ncbi:16S rRNA (uracil(1498)-N(3))-methyltransferase [Candidatus Sumerlaeota bacterium]|nr:16S rRNA (uracil(1498)-N(3))-methyltransferase [Candidatus Sumerlaeota bacterium]